MAVNFITPIKVQNDLEAYSIVAEDRDKLLITFESLVILNLIYSDLQFS